jgi:hypothetical protein
VIGQGLKPGGFKLYGSTEFANLYSPPTAATLAFFSSSKATKRSLEDAEG